MSARPDKNRKKEMAAAYVQTPRRMGVYQIRNTVNGKILVLGTMDLDGARNRLAFMQQSRLNSIIEIREDWKSAGGDAFVFEELDHIKPREEFTGTDAELAAYQEEVNALLEMWLEKLKPYGDTGYNRTRRH